MFVISKLNRGQSTLEYAILVIIIIGALLTIQSYIKRGLQGRVKSASDDIGDQYDPGNTNYLKITNSASSSRQTMLDGQSMTVQLADEVTNSTMTSNIANTAYGGYWGG